MSEGLKELEKIKGLWVEVLNDQDKLVKETVGDLPSTKIIEKELKEYKDLKLSYKMLALENKDLWKKAIALEIIIGSGLSLEHCILIANSHSYEDYNAQFDVFMKKKYQPFRFELRKSEEQYELLKGVLS